MNGARQGGVLIKLLMILTLVTLAGALAWTTLANHRAHGVWSFHPLDPAWWSPQADPRVGADPFAEVAHDAKRLADQAGEALWGPAGLVERCETWWRTNQQQGQAGGSTPGAPGAPPQSGAGQPPVTTVPTSVRGRLEQRLSDSDRRFAEGIELAKRARPALGDDTAALTGRMRTLHQAQACFAEVERELAETIPAYQAVPGHDVSKLASARQLQGFARQMQELTRLTP